MLASGCSPKAPEPANPDTGRQNNQGFEGLTLTPGGKFLVVALQSAKLLSSFCAPFGLSTDSSIPSNGPFSDAVKHWLRQRLSLRYSLARLAHAFSVSPRTLLRRFRAECRESPLTYLRRMRIDAAKKLLVSTTLKVSIITERTGYQDASAFVRMFNRHVGHTPARYRQRFRETQ